MEKITKLLEKFSDLGNEYFETITEVVKELTDSGRKVIVPKDKTFIDIIHFDSWGAYIRNEYGNEIMIEDMSMDDLFDILTILSDKDNYVIEDVFRKV